MVVNIYNFVFSEPGLLEALKYRVEAAEQKFRAAELDDRLSEFEAARQRQVKIYQYFFVKFFFLFKITYLIYFGSIKARQLKKYTEEAKAIRLELSSLSEIDRTLPRECWNTVKLEP